jgi:hypothetical protein
MVRDIYPIAVLFFATIMLGLALRYGQNTSRIIRDISGGLNTLTRTLTLR